MTAGLETFAKVRALHDSTGHPGERLTGQDPAPVHDGHPCRPARAERHAAIRTLIAEGHADREIARRLGTSPTTVGTVRRAGAEASAP